MKSSPSLQQFFAIVLPITSSFSPLAPYPCPLNIKRTFLHIHYISEGNRAAYSSSYALSCSIVICNAEALLAQSTGELQQGDQACCHCREGKGILDGCVRVPNEKFCANCHLCSAKKRCSFQSDPNLAPASSCMVIAQTGKEKSSSLTLEELTQLLDQATDEKRKLEGLLQEKIAEI